MPCFSRHRKSKKFVGFFEKYLQLIQLCIHVHVYDSFYEEIWLSYWYFENKKRIRINSFVPYDVFATTLNFKLKK